MQNINWISLVISTLMPTIIGIIYYNPKLFGTAWRNSLGMTEKELRPKNMAVTMVVSIILSAMLSLVLLQFNNMPGQEGQFDTFGHGAWHGLILGVFIAVPVLVLNGMYEAKKWKTLLINIVYWLILLALMGGVMDEMNHWTNEI